MSPSPPANERARVSRDGSISWPEDVRVELDARDAAAAVYRRKIRDLEGRRRRFLVQEAHRLGIAADNLRDLRSARGNPFERVRHERKDDGRRVLGLLLSEVDCAVEQLSPDDTSDPERAYLCHEPAFFGSLDPQVGCGWVRGVPREEAYDTGHDPAEYRYARGHKLYCQVCGDYIGRRDING